MKAKPEFDVTSAAPVLFYTGPGVVSGVPAADLSANALQRLAWIRAGLPSTVPPSAIAAIRDELIATGYYAVKPEVPEDE